MKNIDTSLFFPSDIGGLEPAVHIWHTSAGEGLIYGAMLSTCSGIYNEGLPRSNTKEEGEQFPLAP